MHVTWVRTLPRWGGAACAVFGFANIVSAVARPSEFTFPGIVIGSAWAAVGLKGGLPLFASAPSVVSSSEKIAQGLRTIRRRRLIAYLSLLAWLLIALAAFPQLPDEFIDTLFFVTVLPVAAFFILWSLSACPRCDHSWFRMGWPRLSDSLSRCHNCNLGLHDAPPANGTA